ncbi:MAG: hypothetical protein RI842_10055 [Schleiferiaceae bacterium]|nr:hypothetical protein [Schleiferiaceae bacterium]
MKAMECYPPSLPAQLDLTPVQQELSELCRNPWGQEQCLQLRPARTPATVEAWLAETDELLQALQRKDHLLNVEYPPYRAFLGRLEIRQHGLKEAELDQLRSAARTYTEAYRYLEKRALEMPRLWAKVQNWPPEKEIVKRIDGVLDEKGQMRPNASPELARIHRELGKSRAAANRIFARIRKKYQGKGLLADFDESVSDQRRVLAVQAAYKGQVNGIFHASSSRQSIVFIEPGETVEVNNRIVELLDGEREEVQRILREVTQALAPYREALEVYAQRLDELDLIRAKALWAQREEACVPRLSEAPEISLSEAYNPVLRRVNRQNDKPTRPLSLTLDTEQQMIVISGPNAGGKSLALKTVGLLQLLLQSGVPVPVHPRSRMGLFRQLAGDIGDAQSIENELSTYSSKLQKMQHFLTHADGDTLLLIDEFGSGSDPALGSALAQVFLEKLHGFGTRAIFTTHFNAIKNRAAEMEGIANAAMLFDRRSFTPRYELQIGQPGSSFTFEVAQQSGIAPHLIAEAKEQVDEGILRTDQLLVEIQDEKIELEAIRHRQEQELQKLRQLQNQQKSQIGRLEQKLQKQTERNTENDRLLYWGQRFQKLVESWLDSGSQKDKKQVVSRFVGMLNQRASETEKTDQQTHQKESRAHEKKLRRFLEEPIHEGQEVKVLSSGMKGTVVAIKGDKYKLALGGNMTAQLDREQFIRADAPLGKKPQKKKRKNSPGKKETQGSASAKASPKKEKAAGPAQAKKPPEKDQAAEGPRNKERGPEKTS